MSFDYEDSGISALPMVTVEAMWQKAESYLNSSSDIVPAPGRDPKAKTVSSHSCIQWKSSQICSHTLAVAESNEDLCSFLEWYNETQQHANLRILAVSELPSRRGQKGGVPKRQRSRQINNQALLLIVQQLPSIPQSILKQL